MITIDYLSGRLWGLCKCAAKRKREQWKQCKNVEEQLRQTEPTRLVFHVILLFSCLQRMIAKAALLLMRPPGADNNAVMPIASRLQTWCDRPTAKHTIVPTSQTPRPVTTVHG
jgi:hypothetical protein